MFTFKSRNQIVFGSTFTEEEIERMCTERKARGAPIFSTGGGESLDDLKYRFYRLEHGYDWNTVDTISRARHVAALRRSVAEYEKEERRRKRKGCGRVYRFLSFLRKDDMKE